MSRIIPLFAALLLTACEDGANVRGDSQAWQVQYLSYLVDPTHPRAIVVAPSEAEFVEVYYRSRDGRGIYVSCDPTFFGDAPELSFGQRGDSDFLGPPEPVTVQFSSGLRLELPVLEYDPALGYYMALPAEVLAGLRGRGSVTVTTASGQLVIDAPLNGAAASLEALQCL